MSRALNAIFRSLSTKRAIGNSDRCFKHVASDLLNASGENMKQLIEGTKLSKGTLIRVMTLEEPYNPQSDTMERIFRHLGAEAHFKAVTMDDCYCNVDKC